MAPEASGRLPHEICGFHADFSYRSVLFKKMHRGVAKVKRNPSNLYAGIGLVVTGMLHSAERAVTFHKHCGTAEQRNEQGKNAVARTRQSCGALYPEKSWVRP